MARHRRSRAGQAHVSSPATAGAVASPQLPQTTRAQGDTFAELSRWAERTGYMVGLGTAGWGGTVDQPLTAAPGYLRYLDLTVYGAAGCATGSVGLSTTPVGVDVALYAGAMINSLRATDAAGNTLYNKTERLAMYLINMFSGQSGLLQAADLVTWPSYNGVGVSTGTVTATGNFLFEYRIPFEFSPGALGTIAAGAANLQPTLHLGFEPEANVFATRPGTLPGITVEVDEAYWAATPDAIPAELGTTLQWQQVVANPSLTSGSSNKIQIGRSDGYLTTLILVFRDSLGFRSDFMLPGGNSVAATTGLGNVNARGNRIQLWLDGVLVLDEDLNERMDVMYTSFPGLAVAAHRVGPVGVLAYTFRNSISAAVLGVDDGALWLPASPATQIELGGVPWGTFANTPGQVTAIIGSIVPGPTPVMQSNININPAGGS